VAWLEGLVGAVEHLKTLCCLGLPPESAMIAVTPLLHEIIPHGWTGIALLEPDATMSSSTYGEHPGTVPLYRERLWKFADDPTSPLSLWLPGFRVVGIGWSICKAAAGSIAPGIGKLRPLSMPAGCSMR
jgi:hypothetical protein